MLPYGNTTKHHNTETNMKKNNKPTDYVHILSSDSDELQLSDDELAIRLGFRIHDAARLRRIIMDDVFKPLGVTRSQAWTLAYLSRADLMAQSDIADEMGLGKVALGGLIDRLEEAGMAERIPDQQDRRIKRIHITKKGRGVVTRMRELTLDINQDILEGISPEDVRQCVNVLRKLKLNLKNTINKHK